MKIKNKIFTFSIIIIFAIILITGCTSKGQKDTQNNQNNSNQEENKAELENITIVLDWVPNTNHTGLYVAKDKGYYEEEGLNVNILQPSEGGSAALVAAGQAHFGISYQEEVTYARTAKDPLPIKAVAAIIQHNTSGFASPVSKGIQSPKDFEGKRYGGWGSPTEEAMLKGLMQKVGGDFSKISMVNIGEADFFAATQRDVDFAWIYYGWDGVASEIKNIPINFIKLQDVVPELDFYTPVIISSENFLEKNPEIASKFLKATSKGYEYAINNPEDAVNSLLKAAPEIDKDIAVASQKYLANEYISDAEKWGVMKEEIWETYGNWMFENGLLESKLDVKGAFTNEFLP
ncbi:MAG TPA: ABC transporter substrate-binding protein [Clostridiaceae bacterium]|nr:ABC transporter substrate-binding protein [Clostridiaceae bacterium]